MQTTRKYKKSIVNSYTIRMRRNENKYMYNEMKNWQFSGGSFKVSQENQSVKVSYENNFALRLLWQQKSSTSLRNDYLILPNDPVLLDVGNKNKWYCNVRNEDNHLKFPKADLHLVDFTYLSSCVCLIWKRKRATCLSHVTSIIHSSRSYGWTYSFTSVLSTRHKPSCLFYSAS